MSEAPLLTVKDLSVAFTQGKNTNLAVDRAIFWQGEGRTAGADGAAQRQS